MYINFKTKRNILNICTYNKKKRFPDHHTGNIDNMHIN